MPLVPALLHAQLKSSRYYAKGSDDLVFQSDNSRKQKENAEECRGKLENVINTAASSVAPREISDSSKIRIKALLVLQGQLNVWNQS